MPPPPRSSSGSPNFGFTKPKGVILWMLVGIFCPWLILSLAANWGGADTSFMAYVVGSTKAVLHGQVWRLVTAPLIHAWGNDFSHVLTTLLVLYFFGPALVDR